MQKGRPTDYTPELAAKICRAIASNALSIKKLCAKYDDFPHHDTINEWLGIYDSFSDQYLVAKEKQAILIADSLWDKVDNLPAITEEMNKFDREFRYQQWHLSKLAPKQFGDKKQIQQEMNINVHEQDLQALK